MKDHWRTIATPSWTSPTTTKKFAEMIQTPLQKDARRHQNKPHGLLEQYSKKANQIKHNKVSIYLYSINWFYLMQEKKVISRKYI